MSPSTTSGVGNAIEMLEAASTLFKNRDDRDFKDGVVTLIAATLLPFTDQRLAHYLIECAIAGVG